MGKRTEYGVFQTIRADAHHGIAVLGLALVRYQAKYGKYPETLDKLVPEFIMFVPKDPCDGKPMKYKRTDYGVVVYSIGVDMVDDGGLAREEHKTEDNKTVIVGDIFFELPDRNPR